MDTVEQDFEKLPLLDPHGLQVALIKEIRELLKGMHLVNEAGDEVAINGYEQSLPNMTEYENDPSEFFPYYIVQIGTGDTKEAVDPWTIDVIIQLGVIDKDDIRHGHIQLISMINKITNHFLDDPILDNAFTAKPEMHWELETGNYYPWYFAAIEMKFDVAKIGRSNDLI